MTVKTKKAPKSSAPATEKARRAALAEIGERLNRIDAPASAPAPAAEPAVGPPVGDDGSSAAKGVRAPRRGKTPMAARVPKPAAPKPPKRVSALDAAATVLASAKEPMRAKEIIADMATQGLWKSPGGLTPEATLYAAMLREIKAKGSDARFVKGERGLFAPRGK